MPKKGFLKEMRLKSSHHAKMYDEGPYKMSILEKVSLPVHVYLTKKELGQKKFDSDMFVFDGSDLKVFQDIDLGDFEGKIITVKENLAADVASIGETRSEKFARFLEKFSRKKEGKIDLPNGKRIPKFKAIRQTGFKISNNDRRKFMEYFEHPTLASLLDSDNPEFVSDKKSFEVIGNRIEELQDLLREQGELVEQGRLNIKELPIHNDLNSHNILVNLIKDEGGEVIDAQLGLIDFGYTTDVFDKMRLHKHDLSMLSERLKFLDDAELSCRVSGLFTKKGSIDFFSRMMGRAFTEKSRRKNFVNNYSRALDLLDYFSKNHPKLIPELVKEANYNRDNISKKILELKEKGVDTSFFDEAASKLLMTYLPEPSSQNPSLELKNRLKKELERNHSELKEFSRKEKAYSQKLIHLKKK